MFTFTPLLGAQSGCNANQSMLEFDGGVKVLVDVGWDEAFSVDKLKELDRQTPTISLILLTHPTLAHLGAYAHCCKHVPLFNRIPVYATMPVISFGRTLTHDLYASTPLACSTLPANALAELSNDALSGGASDSHILLPRPSDDEIASYFSQIHPLKYSQEHQPVASANAPPLEGLTIAAYPAGHTVGGTIWHIRHGSESVVYAVDWNQARENIMLGAAWLGGGSTTGAEVIEQLHQPTALVCSSKRSQVIGISGGWKARDEHLLRHIRETVNRESSVLIPCDSSARVLELAFLLERAWTGDAELRNAKLCLASHQSEATMKYAKSMLEWMDENVVKEFETQAVSRSAHGQGGKGTQPFDFKYLRLLERKSQLDRTLATSGAKVYLATGKSLDWGFSRHLLESLHDDNDSLIILPTKPHASLQSAEPVSSPCLHDLLAAKVDAENTVVQLNDIIDAQKSSISPLGFDETAVYQQYLARQRQRQDAGATNGATALEISADAVEDRSSSSSSEDSDEEHQGKMLNTATTLQHSRRRFGLTDEELGINILLRRKGAHDFDIRGKRGRERVYPFMAKRKRTDEFGDLIRPEDYLRAEERDDVVGQKPAHTTNERANIGQKRRLDGRTSGPNGTQSPRGRANKRRESSTHDDATRQRAGTHNPQDAPDGGASSSESDYEPAEPTTLGPQTVTFSRRPLTLKTRLVAVDYAGIHDKRTLQNLLPLIDPRSLILTAGTADETRLMAAESARLLGAAGGDTTHATRISTPKNGESVDASVDTNAWALKLSETVVRSLRWQPFRALGVATIDGRIGKFASEADDAAPTKRQKRGSDGDVNMASQDGDAALEPDITPVLDALPLGSAGSSASFAQSVHVGDLRLAELRRLLRERGHTAEFKGEGALLVDDYIAVRKGGVGRIEIESGGGYAAVGSFGMGMSEVKRKIYEGLAVVAAR